MFNDVIVVAVLALPLFGLWLVVRGSQRRTQQAQQLAAGLRIGQDVVTTSGLYATITDLDEASVILLVAPGVEVRFDRRAVGRVLDGGDPEAGPGKQDD